MGAPPPLTPPACRETMRTVRLRDSKKTAAREAERHERARAQQEAAFWASPAGRARTAFERGDALFQFELDVRDSQTFTIPMFKTGAITRAKGASDVLNSIARQGWSLVNGSFVFHETGSESRDKFMASGQHIAVQGTVVGYYLFRRDPESRDAAPDREATVERPLEHDEEDRSSYDPR